MSENANIGQAPTAPLAHKLIQQQKAKTAKHNTTDHNTTLSQQRTTKTQEHNAT